MTLDARCSRNRLCFSRLVIPAAYQEFFCSLKNIFITYSWDRASLQTTPLRILGQCMLIRHCTYLYTIVVSWHDPFAITPLSSRLSHVSLTPTSLRSVHRIVHYCT